MFDWNAKDVMVVGITCVFYAIQSRGMSLEYTTLKSLMADEANLKMIWKFILNALW